jgi:hypothetical protein
MKTFGAAETDAGLDDVPGVNRARELAAALMRPQKDGDRNYLHPLLSRGRVRAVIALSNGRHLEHRSPTPRP